MPCPRVLDPPFIPLTSFSLFFCNREIDLFSSELSRELASKSCVPSWRKRQPWVWASGWWYVPPPVVNRVTDTYWRGMGCIRQLCFNCHWYLVAGSRDAAGSAMPRTDPQDACSYVGFPMSCWTSTLENICLQLSTLRPELHFAYKHKLLCPVLIKAELCRITTGHGTN